MSVTLMDGHATSTLAVAAPDEGLVIRAAVSEGAVYELRYAIEAAEGASSPSVRCEVAFFSGARRLPYRQSFELEALPADVGEALGQAFWLSSRYFRAPGGATAAEARLAGSVRTRSFALLPIASRDPRLSAFCSASQDMAAVRGARLAELLELDDRWRSLLRAPADLLGRLGAEGPWKPSWTRSSFAAPNITGELEAFRQRTRRGTSSKPSLGFIGSWRTLVHLSGCFSPVALHPGRPDELKDIDAAALIVEDAVEYVEGDWAEALFARADGPGEAIQRLLQVARERGIPTIRLVRDKASYGSDKTGPWDQVYLIGDGSDLDWTTAPPFVDTRLAAPIRESVTANLRVLFPSAADLFQYPDVATLVRSLEGPHLVITEGLYRIPPEAIKKHISLQTSWVVDCTSYLHLLKLLRNAGVVVLFEHSLASPAQQADLVLDAVASGSVVVYVGDASRLGGAMDLVKEVESGFRLGDVLQALRKPLYREREWLRAYRLLSSRYDLRRLLSQTGLSTKLPGFNPAGAMPLASVIAVTKRPHLLEKIVENFTRQNYENKELLVVFNVDAVTESDLRPLAEIPKDAVSVYVVPQEYNIGFCLNLGRARASGEYWFKCDDDDFYGPDYLGDMVAAFQYSGADVIGKPQGLVHLKGTDSIALRSVSKIRLRRWMKEGESLVGATLAGRRSANLPEFSPRYRNSNDSEWVKAAQRKHRLYFSDPLNYVTWRWPNQGHHTWLVSDADILETSEILVTEFDVRAEKHARDGRQYVEWC